MRHYYFLFFLMIGFYSAPASAKKITVVSATVKDSKTKDPIEFATVEFLSVKDSVLNGCITDSRGYFEMPAPANTYKIRIKNLGYKTLEINFKDKELGILLMEEDSEALKGVTVKGSNLVNRIDRDVYVVTKNLRAGTTSAQELLGRLNGVIYNLYDKSISVNGSTKVLILIDGIEKDQQFAKNLSPERIERVEVIKDPIGKYATDGYTAVINIVLKKNFTGIDFSVDNSAFFDFAGTNGNNAFAQNYGNYNFNYVYKNLNVYSSGFGYAGMFNFASDYVKRYGAITTETQPLDSKNPNSKIRPTNGQFSVGGDYAFAKKHTISVEMKYSGDYQTNDYLYNLTNYNNNVVTGSSSSESNAKSKTDNMQATISYKGKFDEKNSLDADVRYVRTNGYNNNWFRQDNFSSSSNVNITGDYTRVNLTYNRKLSSKLDASIGYGNVYFATTNKMDSSSFTRYNYRNRFSLYLNYKPGKRVNTKIGGIVENYTQSFSGSSKNFTAFLPYINIQYIHNKKFNVVAKFHSSADYPDINQLIPYKVAQDSLMYSEGNPGLKTVITNTAGLDFNIMSFITISPYYSFDNSHIASYIGIDPDNSRHYLSQTVNADKYQRYGVGLNFTVPFGKTIFWQNRFDWYKNKLAYNGESYTVDNLLVNSNIIYVNSKKGIVAGLILQKQASKEAAVQGYSTNGNDILLTMIRKSFLKQKLNVSLFYMLPVDMGLKYNLPTLTQTGSYYQLSHMSLNLIKNLVFFEISYRFASGKEAKAKASSDTDSEQKKKGMFGL